MSVDGKTPQHTVDIPPSDKGPGSLTKDDTELKKPFVFKSSLPKGMIRTPPSPPPSNKSTTLDVPKRPPPRTDGGPRVLKRQHSMSVNISNRINSITGKNAQTITKNEGSNDSLVSSPKKGTLKRAPPKRVYSMSTRYSSPPKLSDVEIKPLPKWPPQKIEDDNGKPIPPKIPPKPTHKHSSFPRPIRPSLESQTENKKPPTLTSEKQELGFKVVRTPKTNGMTTSHSDGNLSKDAILGVDPMAKSGIDDKGRRFTEGKPRDSNYYTLGLEIIPEKKKDSKYSLKGFAKGLKDLLPSRSNNETHGVTFIDENVDLTDWPTLNREIKKWDEFVSSDVSKEYLSMVDLCVLKEGFHVEFGEELLNKPNNRNSEEVNATPTLAHSNEYVPYFTAYLLDTDHVHYLGHDEETDMYWVLSIEDKTKTRTHLRVIVRNRKNYLRYAIEYHASSLTDKARGSHAKLQPLYKWHPELEKIKFVRVKSPDLSEDLRSMEMKEVALGMHYKFGVLYMKPRQTEDEMFANENPGPDFEEFLDFLGDRIELSGWEKYKGGLDTKNNSTGTHSIYHEIQDVEVMFHVCSMLPSQEQDVQRVERKRHIGNDVVVFVFLEEGCEPYVATKLTSQFIHIHILVQKVKYTTGNTKYKISVVTKAGVEPHLPILPAILEKTKENRDLLLTKAINAERTAMLSPEFRSKMLRARKDFLKYLYDTYASQKKKKSK